MLVNCTFLNSILLIVPLTKTSEPARENPDANKVDFKTTIQNNIFTIERFNLKFTGFRLRIEGKTSFEEN